MTLYIVIERFRNGDPAPVYRRFRERGRMAPEGLVYVSSWRRRGHNAGLPMLISATVNNRFQRHQVTLTTSGKSHALEIPPRESGLGSAANGGEFLCLAMATCYCNDIYREAAKRGIEVLGVEVHADAEFESEGAPAKRLSYRVAVRAKAPEASIRDLIKQTDRVAEVQNTLRLGLPVTLELFSAVSSNA